MVMSKTVEIIKGLRSAGLSQAEIARRTGVGQWTISRWERGAVASAAEDVLKLQALAQDVAAKGDGAPAVVTGTPIGQVA